MSKLWQLIGRVGFWLSWPASYVYLRIGMRSRVLVVTDDKEVLLVRGWLSSGQWSLPGGGLHWKEDPKEGALRELREETGIKLSSRELIQLGQDVQSQHGLCFRYYQFTAKIPHKKTIKKQFFEITDYTWVPIEKLNSLSIETCVEQTAANWKTEANLL